MKNFKLITILFLTLLMIQTNSKGQEVLTNQSILSLVTAKVDNDIIINKIKGSENKFDLGTDGIIALKQGKVNDKIVEEMFLVAQNLPLMNNQDVISLQKAAVSKKIILRKINSSECKFNTSTEALIALKEAGVNEEITKVMMDPSTSVSLGSGNLIATKLPLHPQDIPAPKSLPSSGIFYEAYSPSVQYLQIEPTTTNQTKQGGFGEAIGNHYSMGISGTSSKVGLANASANTVIEDAQPVFYFHVERDGKSIDEVVESTYDGVASPNDFVLVQARVTKRGREIEVARKNAYGNESGFAKGTVPFRFKKVSDRLYKVYFEKEVPAGEYAFYYNKGSEQKKSLKLFDFSLKNNISANN